MEGNSPIESRYFPKFAKLFSTIKPKLKGSLIEFNWHELSFVRYALVDTPESSKTNQLNVVVNSTFRFQNTI